MRDPHRLRSVVLIPLITVICVCIPSSNAYQEVLFDLAKASGDLRWEQVSLRHERDDVWMEETWRNPNSPADDKHANQRAYVTCNYDMVNPSNWLFTHMTSIKDARRIFLEILFNTRDCENYNNPKSCKETFSVFMKQYNSTKPDDVIDRRTFNARNMQWRNIGRLARSNLNMTTETLGVALDPSTRAVRFAFEEQGVCLSLLNIKIYYRVCDEFTDELVYFKPHVTGPKDSDVVKMNGSCVAHASKKIKGVDLVGLCMASGQSMKTSGECQCDPGYSTIEDSNGSRCESCPANSFKPRGERLCQPCPANSFSSEAAGSCRCVEGFFRSDDDLSSMACTQSPTRPVKLAISGLSSTSARLSWEEPTNLGGRSDIWYEVKCRGDCSTVVMTPSEKRLSTRYVQLNGLRPSADYTFLVIAKNKVSSQLADPNGSNAVVDVRTKSAEEDVPPVSNLRVDAAQNDGLTIGWSSADSNFGDFEVEVRPAIGSRRAYETRRVNTTYVTFIGLKSDVVYGFRVRLHEDLRWSEAMSYQLGKGQVHATEEVNGRTDIGDSSVVNHVGSALLLAIVACLVVIAAALCTIVLQKRSKNRKQMSDLDVLDTYKQDSMTPDYHTAPRHMNGSHIPTNLHEQLRSATKLNAPLIPSFGSPISQPPPYYGGVQANSGKYKTYVDPTTYEDPYQALIEFTFDIDPHDIFITQVIGGGEFGDVCLGGLARTSSAATKWPNTNTVNRMFENEQFETVAIKTLKAGSNAKAKAEFLTEATIMGQFSHPNVIRLIGVVTSAEPVMIVAEYMSNGSLDHFMRARDERREKLTWEKVTEMLYGIASGMKYLTDMGYVHRDLAARNVLVDTELRCKIADFGLSRGVRGEGSVEPEYTTNGGKIPVRWTAPEAITHRKFTPSSDVWSFGVVIWETCSYGERPYWDWTNQKVISEIMVGYRLPPPMDCPMGIYRIAQWCWRMDRHDRPTFTQLVATLHKYILQPHLISNDPGELPKRTTSVVNLNTYGSISNVPTPPSSAPPLPTLEEFLRSIGMNHVLPRLTSCGVLAVADLSRTSHLDLLAAGLISQECAAIRDALQGRTPQIPAGSGTMPAHTKGSRLTQQQGTIGNGVVRRDEGFFV